MENKITHRKRGIGRILLLCGLLLAACENDTPPAPSGVTKPEPGATAPNANVEPLKPPQADGIPSGEVRMHLSSDPRLQSPITTLVSPGKQELVVRFGDAMNTASVEQAIQKQLFIPEASSSPAAVKIDVKLQYRWEGDRTLHVTAEPVINKLPDYPLFRYQIDVSGSLTAGGSVLGKVPAFQAVVDPPSQLWRVSADGARREKVSGFTEPYWFQRLDGDPNYVIATRTTGYCECDAPSLKHYSVYDVANKELVHYPVILHTTYQGPGQFVADTRGFFYEETNQTVPSSTTTHKIKVDGYVHGASLSKDRNYVLMAVGETKETTANLDFILYKLSDGTAKRMPQALLGSVPENMVSSGLMPVPFTDNGKEVRALLMKNTNFDWTVNVYAWDKGSWQQQEQPEMNRSGDGVYAVDTSDRLYHNDKLVQGVKAPSGFQGIWLGKTHRYVYLDYNFEEANAKKVPPKGSLFVYDADLHKAQQLVSGLDQGDMLFSTSSDGTWIYILSKHELPGKQ
ncbi:hypothetical protein [Paenibacillus silviterrae]|uniref:hypothetical protein n=1 Tax=Paenibacillus silviterrae TaxID=3242194 RepID=UPI002542DFB0|nr:hypothetical protein [Paenibacillus chinjuensis]